MPTPRAEPSSSNTHRGKRQEKGKVRATPSTEALSQRGWQASSDSSMRPFHSRFTIVLVFWSNWSLFDDIVVTQSVYIPLYIYIYAHACTWIAWIGGGSWLHVSG